MTGIPVNNTAPAPLHPTVAPPAGNPFGTPRAPQAEQSWEVDITGVDLSGSRPPAGLWDAKVSSVTKETSKAGNPMFVWTLTITEGQHAGRSGKIWTATTAEAMWKFVEVADALGLKPNENGKYNFGPSDVLGTLCQIEVIDDTYEGRPTTSIDRVLPSRYGLGVKAPTLTGIPS
jgi:hypothetical protein